MHVSLDPQFTMVPGVFRDPRFEIFDLEPVFDIDGEKKGGSRGGRIQDKKKDLTMKIMKESICL